MTGSGSDQQPVSGKAGVEQVNLDFSGRKPDGSGVTRLTDVNNTSLIGNNTGTVDMANYMIWRREDGYCFAGNACTTK